MYINIGRWRSQARPHFHWSSPCYFLFSRPHNVSHCKYMYAGLSNITVTSDLVYPPI